jgi:enoyl-[acyl-carrier-protein] reductase (NADH)
MAEVTAVPAENQPEAAGPGRDPRGRGHAAVFAASDWSRGVTAAIVNVSAGALID